MENKKTHYEIILTKADIIGTSDEYFTNNNEVYFSGQDKSPLTTQLGNLTPEVLKKEELKKFLLYFPKEQDNLEVETEKELRYSIPPNNLTDFITKHSNLDDDETDFSKVI